MTGFALMAPDNTVFRSNEVVRRSSTKSQPLGCLPFNPPVAALVLHLLSKRYEGTGVVITTDPSFSERARSIGDAKELTALLDRLTNHRHRKVKATRVNYLSISTQKLSDYPSVACIRVAGMSMAH